MEYLPFIPSLRRRGKRGGYKFKIPLIPPFSRESVFFFETKPEGLTEYSPGGDSPGIRI